MRVTLILLTCLISPALVSAADCIYFACSFPPDGHVVYEPNNTAPLCCETIWDVAYCVSQNWLKEGEEGDHDFNYRSNWKDYAILTKRFQEFQEQERGFTYPLKLLEPEEGVELVWDAETVLLDILLRIKSMEDFDSRDELLAELKEMLITLWLTPGAALPLGE